MADEELKQEVAPEKEEVNSNAELDKMLTNAKPIEKPSKDQKDYSAAIEEARLDFFKKYKKGRLFSYIAMGVVLALAVASVICITLKSTPAKIVGWSLIGVAVVGMLVFYIVSRNNLPNATKEYIEVVNQQLNMRNFSDTRFSEVSTDKNEKIELSDPISDGIYKGLNNIASRNVINGKFDGRTFKLGDMGVYTGQGRARGSAFVGKYFTYLNDLHFEGRYILVSKGNAPVDLPTDIEDLVVLEETESFMIYGKEGAKPASDLTAKFLDKIKAVKVENHLLNLNVVVWGGHSSVYASYDDQIMTLPYEKEFDNSPNEQYAKNLLSLFDALSLLVKKEK